VFSFVKEGGKYSVMMTFDVSLALIGSNI